MKFGGRYFLKVEVWVAIFPSLKVRRRIWLVTYPSTLTTVVARSSLSMCGHFCCCLQLTSTARVQPRLKCCLTRHKGLNNYKIANWTYIFWSIMCTQKPNLWLRCTTSCQYTTKYTIEFRSTITFTLTFTNVIIALYSNELVRQVKCSRDHLCACKPGSFA